MHYADIKQYDVANGPGVRISLFVSGCTHRCPNCFNEEAWDFNYGQPFTDETIDTILEYFGDEERIIGVCFPDYVDSDLRAGFSRLKEAGKKIYIFTCDSAEEADYIREIGADGAYVDFPSVLE